MQTLSAYDIISHTFRPKIRAASLTCYFFNSMTRHITGYKFNITAPVTQYEGELLFNQDDVMQAAAQASQLLTGTESPGFCCSLFLSASVSLILTPRICCYYAAIKCCFHPLNNVSQFEKETRSRKNNLQNRHNFVIFPTGEHLDVFLPIFCIY